MSTPHIVVIDDHPAVRQGLATLLDAVGYGVVLHPNAAGAAVVIRRLQPAVVLIDLHVEYPLAGLDVVRALRAEAATAAIPLVVWSSDPAVAHHVATLQVPDVAVLSKLDDPALLVAALARATAAGAADDDPAA